MSETARSALQRIPSLVSLSTLAMASDFSYECPSGMFSLLCAVTGSCSLAAADRSIHLVGSRMALLSGRHFPMPTEMKSGLFATTKRFCHILFWIVASMKAKSIAEAGITDCLTLIPLRISIS